MSYSILNILDGLKNKCLVTLYNIIVAPVKFLCWYENEIKLSRNENVAYLCAVMSIPNKFWKYDIWHMVLLIHNLWNLTQITEETRQRLCEFCSFFTVLFKSRNRRWGWINNKMFHCANVHFSLSALKILFTFCNFLLSSFWRSFSFSWGMFWKKTKSSFV